MLLKVTWRLLTFEFHLDIRAPEGHSTFNAFDLDIFAAEGHSPFAFDLDIKAAEGHSPLY